MIAVVNLQISNLRSVMNALRRVDCDPSVTDSAGDIERADAIVLPGVGAFGKAMDALRDKGLVEPLRRRVLGDSVPLLGICLGMQLLADSSEEHGRHVGLGLVPGRVTRLAPRTAGFRVPNIGWYGVRPAGSGRLFPEAAVEQSFYFVHGFHLGCADVADVAATIDYGGQAVTAAVERANIFGVQFHPERSQDAGLDLLKRFVGLVERRQRAA